MSYFRKYFVAYNEATRTVQILNEDQKDQTGHHIIGEFEADPLLGEIKGEEDFDSQGSHIFITKANAFLNEVGITDLTGITYEDKASNAPQGGYVLTHKEREEAIREGENPSEKRAEITENLEAADKKMDKVTAKKKASTRKTKSTK